MNGNPTSIPPDGKHRYAVRVYYEDTDAGGVVYHATYLRFAERARTEALRDAGIAHAELLERFTLMFVVRRIEVDYLRPARLDESLTVVTVRLACVKPGEGKPGRLPQRWRTVLADMCAAAQHRG